MPMRSIGVAISLMLLLSFVGFYYPVLPPLEPIVEWGYNYKVVVYPATFTWSGEVRKFRGYIEFFLPDNFTHASEDLILKVHYKHDNTNRTILKKHLEYNETIRIDFEYIGEARPDCELVVGLYNRSLCEEIRGRGMMGWVIEVRGRDYEFSLKPYKCILYDRLINAIPLSLVGLLVGLLITAIIGKWSEEKQISSRIPYRGGM